MTKPARQVRESITEKAFMEQVVALAKLRGWKVFHPYDSRRSEPGWPDVTLVRGGRILFAELKSEKGKVSEAQQSWLDALGECSCDWVGTWVFRPSDWPRIEEELK